MSASLVVLTGASGSGKTTIALGVKRAHPEYDVCCFDSIGVPSAEEIASFGTGHQPGGAWQREMTLRWFARLALMVGRGRSVLFEGQMRIGFIREALSVQTISHPHIIFVDCDDSTREMRLIQNRGQPELANENVKAWSRYLRREAIEAGVEVLNTSERTVAESVAHVVRYLRP